MSKIWPRDASENYKVWSDEVHLPQFLQVFWSGKLCLHPLYWGAKENTEECSTQAHPCFQGSSNFPGCCRWLLSGWPTWKRRRSPPSSCCQAFLRKTMDFEMVAYYVCISAPILSVTSLTHFSWADILSVKVFWQLEILSVKLFSCPLSLSVKLFVVSDTLRWRFFHILSNWQCYVPYQSCPSSSCSISPNLFWLTHRSWQSHQMISPAFLKSRNISDVQG